jgi:hypothetical protein
MFNLFVTEKTRKKNTKDIWDDEEVEFFDNYNSNTKNQNTLVSIKLFTT